MEETQLSKDVNPLGLLRMTLLFLVFWGSLEEKAVCGPFSLLQFFFFSLGDHAMRFIGIEKA